VDEEAETENENEAKGFVGMCYTLTIYVTV